MKEAPSVEGAFCLRDTPHRVATGGEVLVMVGVYVPGGLRNVVLT